MKRALALAALILLASAPSRADTKSIPLKYLSTGSLAGILADPKSLLLPEGIESVTLELKKNAVTFVGSAESVAQAEELLRLLDVKPKQVDLVVRLIRDGKELGRSAVSTASGQPTRATVLGLFVYDLLPRANGDGTILVRIETDSEKAVRRLTPGKPQSIPFKDVQIVVSAAVKKEG